MCAWVQQGAEPWQGAVLVAVCPKCHSTGAFCEWECMHTETEGLWR